MSTTNPSTMSGTGTTVVDSSSSVDDTSSGGADSTSTGDGSASSSESTGAPEEPEIEVTIDAAAVLTGESYDFADTVDVGMVGGEVTVTIDNVGTADLNVAGVTLTLGDTTHFTLDTAMLDAVVAPAASTSFTVAFSPANGGIKGATVSIDNDDADEAPFEIVLGAHTTANTYRDLAPGAGPSARFNAAMADLGDGRVLLFGGRDVMNNRLDDTWVFDIEAGTWTQLMPMMAPSPRDAHEMVYTGDSVVLFGGNEFMMGLGSIATQDTWVFDIATEEWTMMMPAEAPPQRFQHGMVFVGGDTVLLFGGMDSIHSYLGDTWAYDVAADTWTDLAPMGAPSARTSFTLGYDGIGTVTLHGGYNDPGLGPANGETWNYDVVANTWTEGMPMLTPGLRLAHTGAYYADGRFIMHSGKLDSCCVDPSLGTYAYDAALDDWVDLAPPTEPTPRFNHAMAYIAGTNKSIIFGGNFINIGPDGAVDETWEYVGPQP